MAKRELSVETPAGEISAEAFGTYSEYPGLTVFINGEQVATIEYDTGNDRLQANVWDAEQEDPVFHIEYPELRS